MLVLLLGMALAGLFLFVLAIPVCGMVQGFSKAERRKRAAQKAA